jgi:hypothetical protein
MRSGRSGELSAAAAILLATVALCGLQWIKPLHASRTGHRQAAAWLATEATVPGHVFDSHGFSSLYSGRATYPPDALRAATCDPHLVYLVLESQELDFDSVRSRTLRSLIATAAEPVAAFPAGGPEGSRQRVVIYRWHADRFLRWLSAHTAGKGTKHRHARFGERIHPERG